MYLSLHLLSEVLGTQMLGGPPPLVHEGDHLGLQGLSAAEVEVGLDLIQPRGPDHHRVAPRTVQGRVVVDPAKSGLRDTDSGVRVMLGQELWNIDES